MPKIKVTKAPTHGSQSGYGLVRNMFPYYSSGDEDRKVKETLGPVPRDEANVEAEKGEVALGDINGDGFIELMEIGGKKHYNNGTPLNIPPGTFIFSDTPKMIIKDKELLKLFYGGKNLPKSVEKGVTPAAIAKRYKINDYVETIKSPDSDDLSKRTAQSMIDKNMEKLALLALIQEQSKGMPDGIPDIVQSIIPSIGDDSGEDIQTAKFGGLTKYQNAGTTGEPLVNRPKTKTEKPVEENKNNLAPTYSPKITSRVPIYINGQPFRFQREVDNSGIFTGNSYEFVGPNGEKYYLDQKEYESVLDKDKPYRYSKKNEFEHLYVTTTPEAYKERPITHAGLTKGDILGFEGKYFIVENPDVLTVPDKNKSYSSAVAPGMYTTVTNKPGVKLKEVILEFDENGNIIKRNETKNEHIIESETIARYKNRRELDYIPAEVEINESKIESKETLPKKDEKKNSTSKQNTKTDNELKSFMQTLQLGGLIKTMQIGGTLPADYVKDESKSNDKFDVYKKEGSKYVIVTDKEKNILGVRNTETKEIYEYGDKSIPAFSNLEELQKKGIKPILPKSDNELAMLFFVPGMQHKREDETYGNIDILSSENFNDFKNRFKSFFEENPDINESNIATGKNTEKFQRWYNTFLSTKAKEKYYSDEEIKQIVNNLGFTTEKNKPNSLDNQFGQYTWSRVPFDFEQKGEKEEKTAEQKPKEKAQQTSTNVEEYKPNSVTSNTAIDDSFFTPDVVNFSNILDLDMPEFRPTMSKINPKVPDYTLLDPSRQIAAQQEQQAMMLDQMENMAAANIAAATVLGGSGKDMAQVANILGNYEMQNVDISNRAAANEASILNNADIVNEKARQEYLAQSANFGENLAKQKNQKHNLLAKGYTTMWENRTKDNMLRQLFPQYAYDRVTGSGVGFSGQGRDIMGIDTYVNPMTNKEEAFDYKAVQQQVQSIYDAAYEENVSKYGEDRASEIAKMRANNHFELIMKSAKSKREKASEMLDLNTPQFGGELPDYSIFD